MNYELGGNYIETAQTSVNNIIILSTKHSGRLIKVWVESGPWLDSHSKPLSEYLKFLHNLKLK